MITKIALIGVIIIGLTGLIISFPMDSGANNSQNNQEFKRIYPLYQKKCLKCHNHYNPLRWSANEWKNKVNQYSNRAKLTESEKKDIIKLRSLWQKNR